MSLKFDFVDNLGDQNRILIFYGAAQIQLIHNGTTENEGIHLSNTSYLGLYIFSFQIKSNRIEMFSMCWPVFRFSK